MPPKGADEGAMIERFFVGPDALIGPLDGSFRRGFRRLRAASFFPSDGKETKGSPGTRPMDYGSAYAPPRSIGPLSPDPIYGGYPLRWAEHFRRAKSEWPSAIQSGPLGPGFVENWGWCGSTNAPGFAEPTLPVRSRRRGGTSGPPGNGPMGASGPTKDQTHLRIRRRGGCPHPPAGPLSQT